MPSPSEKEKIRGKTQGFHARVPLIARVADFSTVGNGRRAEEVSPATLITLTGPGHQNIPGDTLQHLRTGE